MSKLRKVKEKTLGRSWPTGIISKKKNTKKYGARKWTGLFG
jgi:hypothetical protein